MPILIAFDGAAPAALLVDDELLLLPPHAANHSAHTARTATAVSDRLNRCLTSPSNLVTSSATCFVVQSGRFR
jgi:hypothetical protein